MTPLCRLVGGLGWPILIALCLTLGLAPFVPVPHVWEKLDMLITGRLTRPLDLADLLLHGLPWLLLVTKGVCLLKGRGSGTQGGSGG